MGSTPRRSRVVCFPNTKKWPVRLFYWRMAKQIVGVYERTLPQIEVVVRDGGYLPSLPGAWWRLACAIVEGEAHVWWDARGARCRTADTVGRCDHATHERDPKIHHRCLSSATLRPDRQLQKQRCVGGRGGGIRATARCGSGSRSVGHSKWWTKTPGLKDVARYSWQAS